MDRYIGQTVVCVGNIHQTIVDCFVLEAFREYRDNLREHIMSDDSDRPCVAEGNIAGAGLSCILGPFIIFGFQCFLNLFVLHSINVET